jgi:hypothetical protein
MILRWLILLVSDRLSVLIVDQVETEIGEDALEAIGRKLLHLGMFLLMVSDTTQLCSLTVRLGKIAQNYLLCMTLWYCMVVCQLQMGLSLYVWCLGLGLI